MWLTVIAGSSSIASSQDVCEGLPRGAAGSFSARSPNLTISHHCAHLKPRRIVIVTAKNREDRLDEQDQYARSLAQSLAKCGFSVVVSPDHLCADELPMQRGHFSEAHLVRLNRKYRADAVIYCHLRQLVSFEPMSVEGSLVMVHIDQAVALLSLRAVHDLRDMPISQAYEHFSKASQPEDAFGSNYQHSPTQFINFVAHQNVQQMLKAWNY